MSNEYEPTPKSRTTDPNFDALIKSLKEQFADSYKNRTGHDQPKWLMPEKEEQTKWSGDLYKWEDVKDAFVRNTANEQYLETISDEPGVVGDLTKTTMQIDHIATMERAFLARHASSWPRVTALALGRHRGHGNDKAGTFDIILYYFDQLSKEMGEA